MLIYKSLRKGRMSYEENTPKVLKLSGLAILPLFIPFSSLHSVT